MMMPNRFHTVNHTNALPMSGLNGRPRPGNGRAIAATLLLGLFCLAGSNTALAQVVGAPAG